LLAGTAIFLLWGAAAQAEIKVGEECNRDDATPEFKFKKIAGPVKDDAASKAKFTIVDGTVDENSGGLDVMHDGKLPVEEDQPERNFFFAPGEDGGRLAIDLGKAIDVKQVNTYSWHPDTRGPQVYKLYAADGSEKGFNGQPKKGTDPAKCGWKLIASVDTRGKAAGGGQYGVSIADSGRAIGKYRYLLFDISATEKDDLYGNTFFSRINVIDANRPKPPGAAAPSAAPPSAGRPASGPADGAGAADGPWTSDFAAAKARARSEKKLLLVDFTGSDWCVWCKKLHAEVLDKDVFQTEAPKQFVLVELDFPNAKKLPEEVEAQNKKLAREYKITGFPTVLLLDAEGKVVAHTGYRPGGPDKYMTQLGEFTTIYEGVLKLKASLEKLQGLERAKALDKLVTAHDKLNNPADEVLAWSKEIVALDADNKAGLRTTYALRVALTEADHLAQERRLADAIAVLDKGLEISGLSGEQKQDLLLKQSTYNQNRRALAAAVACLNKALAAAPDSAQAPRIKTMLKSLASAAEADELIAKNMDLVDQATGLDRAKLLDKLLDANARFIIASGMGTKIPPSKIAAWEKEIPELDVDNKAGLKVKYQFTSTLREARALAMQKKFDEVQTTIDKALALTGITAEQTQEGLTMKGNYYLNVNDIPRAVECLKKALDAAPEGHLAALDKALLAQAEKRQKAQEEKPAKPAD